MFATMDGNDRQNIEYHLKTIEKDNDVIKNLSQQIIINENFNTTTIQRGNTKGDY